MCLRAAAASPGFECDGMRKQAFEWSEGSLFAPPLATWHSGIITARDQAFLPAVATARSSWILPRPSFVFQQQLCV